MQCFSNTRIIDFTQFVVGSLLRPPTGDARGQCGQSRVDPYPIWCVKTAFIAP